MDILQEGAHSMGMKALITGITGQDGSYLAEYLLDKQYEVYGLVRRLSHPNYERIEHILPHITLIQGDLLDQSSLERAIDVANPDEVYNLGAMTHVGTSFTQPVAAGEYTGMGTLRMLEACRMRGKRTLRFYQASTSELFGNAPGPQNELTPMKPRSPYGNAKLFAHESVRNYRDSYGMFACAGILFNHESPRRGFDFVTRKITDGIAKVKCGYQKYIELGNLDAYRDWGYAGDYVQAMWLMLQQPQPKDYVIATGETHSVGEFVAKACEYAGLPLPWHNYVQVNSKFLRPSDVNVLVGDASLAHRELDWTPHVSFSELVAMMVQADLRRVTYERPTGTLSSVQRNYQERARGREGTGSLAQLPA